MDRKFVVALVVLAVMVGLAALKVRSSLTAPVIEKKEVAKQEVIEVKKEERQRFCDPVSGMSKKFRAKSLAQMASGSFEVNLTGFYFTDEELAQMAQVDFTTRGNSQNQSQEWETSIGKFQMVTAYGKGGYSINPSAKRNLTINRYDAMRLPNGKWVKLKLDSRLSDIVEKDSQVFFICQNHIFEYAKGCKLECLMIGPTDDWSIYQVWQSRDYLWVQKPGSRDFGGLLTCNDGKWTFHQYQGKYGSCLEKVEKKDSLLILHLLDGWDEHSKHILVPRIQFDPKTGSFTDL